MQVEGAANKRLGDEQPAPANAEPLQTRPPAKQSDKMAATSSTTCSSRRRRRESSNLVAQTRRTRTRRRAAAQLAAGAEHLASQNNSRRRTVGQKLIQLIVANSLLVALFLLLSPQATNLLLLSKAFNIDTQSAIVHLGPQNSYFGYSVALHKDRSVNWLLVGAPKAQTDQTEASRSGAVYRCGVSSARAYQQIPFDPNGSSTLSLRGQGNQTDDKSHQRFGFSL